MIWAWRIFFSWLALAPLFAGSVSGKIELVDSRDPDVRKHRDFSGVVVWLNPVSSPAALSAPGKADGVRALRSRPPHAEMVQKDKRFTPHVLAIPVGTPVDFPNLDPIFHNAFSNFSGQIFDVGLYPPGSSRTVVFKRPGIVRVFCNIHPTMSAIIVVLETLYFAVSGSRGTFEIPNVPPGEYQLSVFHERAAEEKLQSAGRRVVVENGPLVLAPVVISETGYLPVPHHNKYGKDYPPVTDEIGPYSGTRK